MSSAGIERENCDRGETQQNRERAFVKDAIEWHVQNSDPIFELTDPGPTGATCGLTQPKPPRGELDLRPKHPDAMCRVLPVSNLK
jgi:hypothetical protein